MATAKKAAPKKAVKKQAPKRAAKLEPLSLIEGYEVEIQEGNVVSFGCGSVKVDFKTIKSLISLLEDKVFVKQFKEYIKVKNSVPDDFTEASDFDIMTSAAAFNKLNTPAFMRGLKLLEAVAEATEGNENAVDLMSWNPTELARIMVKA